MLKIFVNLLERVVVRALRHVLGCVADKLVSVEDGSLGAADLPGLITSLAHVEEAAVAWVGITGMVELLSVGVDLGLVGACETVGKDHISVNAAGTESSVGPLANSGEFVEDQSGVALVEYGHATGTFVVLTAVGGVLVFEVTVLTGAFDTGGLGGLQGGSFVAVDDEWPAALFNTWGLSLVED